MDALLEATPEQLTEVEGIGPIMASTVHETLAEDRVRDLIGKLREHGLRMEEEGPAPPAEGPLVGKTLVITGTLPSLSRDEATSESRRRRARSPARCRRTPTTCVAGEEAGSKYAKAQKLGTEIIDEDLWLLELT